MLQGQSQHLLEEEVPKGWAGCGTLLTGNWSARLETRQKPTRDTAVGVGWEWGLQGELQTPVWSSQSPGLSRAEAVC